MANQRADAPSNSTTDRPPVEPRAGRPGHKPADHRPVIFPWWGKACDAVGRTSDAVPAGHLVRAAMDDCEKHMSYWAEDVARGDGAITLHLVMAAWSQSRLYRLPEAEFFGAESAAILGAVHEWRLSDAVRMVDDLPWSRRYDMLSDAVSLLGTPPSVLIDEALERARAQREATLRAAEAA